MGKLTINKLILTIIIFWKNIAKLSTRTKDTNSVPDDFVVSQILCFALRNHGYSFHYTCGNVSYISQLRAEIWVPNLNQLSPMNYTQVIQTCQKDTTE